MAFVKWDETFSVNIDSIDEQHKVFLNLINEFYEKLLTDKNFAIANLLTGLEEYAVTHFQYEQKYFNEFGYPETEEHLKEHGSFFEKVDAFKLKFEAGQTKFSIELAMFLRDWLINHIKDSDKKYSEFFIKNGLK